MGVMVIVEHLGQLFSRHVKIIWQVVIAGSENNFARAVGSVTGKPVDGADGEVSVLAGKAGYGLVLTKLQLVMLSDLAIVFERLVTAGFLVRAGKRHITNFQQLR